MKPLLVGESNPYGSDPKYALYPWPEQSAGARLCHKILGLQRLEYLERFDRVNLCAHRWNTSEARVHAQKIIEQGRRYVVLFGVKVTGAFGLDFRPTFRVVDHCGTWLVVLPHPSGLSREWHEPGAFERARALLCEAGVL